MTKRLRGILAFLLVFILFATMVPPMSVAAASDTADTTATQPTEAETVETTAPTEEAQPSETSPPAEETIPDDTAMDSPDTATASEDYGIMPFALSDRLTNVTLFDLASPYNYTIMLPSQVTVKYRPNGTDASKTAYLKNIAWHFYSYGGTQYKDDTIYCIEPHKNFAASTPGNYCDQGVDVYGSSNGSNGSNVWYNMPTSYRSAIAYILQFSEMRWDHSVSVTAVSKNNNPNFALRTATQVLIYEIVMGLRDADTFERNDSNGYVEGRILYDAFKDQVANFRDSYNALVADVQNAERIPSFCGSSSSNAPTITLTDYLTWVHDDNEVMGSFTFTGDDCINLNPYDNDLCIENYGGLTGTRTYSCRKARPSTGSASFSIFYPSGSTYQTCVNLLSPATSSTYGYFKVYAPVSTGDLSLTKTTSDGKNLSGWQFSIYSNSACTNLVSGPHTTNSSGKIAVSGLSAGTYYVKEIGHQTSSINSQYTCTNTNPQKVTITAGSTASVSFTNTLKPGSLNLKKTTSDGKNLQGWQFSIYSNAACTTLISGPHTTNSSGTISVTNLTPGTYYVKEVGHTDASIAAKYTCTSTNPQAVTIAPGGTASVSFTNTLKLGSIQIIKTTNTGSNLSGWQIGLYTDKACTAHIPGSPFTTGADGTISVTGLNPGTYYAKEIAGGDSYWACDTSVKTVTVSSGQTASVTFTNTHYGRIAVQKSTNTGSHLSGWKFQIRNGDGDTVAEIVTDENGYAVTGNLPLGRYTVRELLTDDDYWQVELGFHDVTVKAGETVTDEWTNVEQGLARIYKKTNTGESVEGWEITIYSDEACTQEVYTLTTNEDGYAGYYISPGIYWAKETGDTEGRFDSEYWLVDERVQKFEVKPHEDVSIEFSNVQYGKLKIVKAMESEGPLAGWQFQVTDSDGKEIDGSPFATQEDGTILIGSLLPGELTVEELLPEDSPYTCTSENPQKVTIQAGSVSEVSFTNALVPGKITIHKVDSANEPLAGAKFLLEWSEDGAIWWPITYSSEETAEKGGCGNPNVEDGCLISGADGLLEWGNLYPTLYYRVTELEAPEGYELLKDYAYEGLLPEETRELSFRVVNCPGFTLPDTGVNSMRMVQLFTVLLYAAFISFSLWDIRRKEFR